MSSLTTTTRAAKGRRKSARGRMADGAANPIDIHVGQRIRLRRTLLGKSQEWLAAQLGLTFQQVQKYERGANRVGASRLFDLARMLDVPVGFFFDDMDAATAGASPAAVVAGTAPSTLAYDRGELADRRTLELVRNFKSIPDEKARDGVYNLIRSLTPADLAAAE